MTFTAQGNSDEIARALHNALTFLPLRTNPPLVRAVFDSRTVTFLATDMVTVGQDWAEIENGPAERTVIWLDQTAAKQIEAAARKDCVPKSRAPIDAPDGQGRGVLAFHPDDALTYTPQLDHITVSARDHTGSHSALGIPFASRPEALWEACDGLLEAPLPHDPWAPRPMMVDPALWARFAKVKTPGKELGHMDMWFADNGNTVQVKIGSRFRGAIMFIDRERAAENERMEPEGLW